MSHSLRRRSTRSALIMAAGVTPALLLAPVAYAGPATGTNLLSNGNFATGVNTSATPAGWTTVNLGVETAPYHTASTNSYNATGSYPPPAGNPDAGDVGLEDYYEVGSSVGVEGYGVTQTPAAAVTQADDPQVSYSTAPTYLPSATHSAWGGSLYEVDFTSGGQSYTLAYFDPWSASSTGPTNSATVHYIVGPTLTKGSWYTQSPRDLNADILNSFSLSTYTVSDVTVADLEDTTGTTSPYPNMTGYFADVALAEGAPAAVLPEAPFALGLPIAGVAMIGGAVLVLRRRRRPTDVA